MPTGWTKINSGAEYAGIKQRTFRKLLRMGLPHSKLPTGVILVKYSDIDEFISRYRVNSNRVDDLVNDVLRDVEKARRN